MFKRMYDDNTGEFYCYDCHEWFEIGSDCACEDRFYTKVDNDYDYQQDLKEEE